MCDVSVAHAQVVLNGSDVTPVLQLSQLVAGRFVFTLTVSDNEGLSDSDTASLIVKHSECQPEADFTQCLHTGS